ncbi:hypothetical protein QE152_g30095 [Popillia japonica]|uniref:ABC-2 type transporter transmembrane domain-containing protein n=1 Tax=Popillia japonica TaxID=7064 RepID=A0AAW1JG63_POPJA
MILGYFDEGFLTLQYYISREFIKYHVDNDSFQMPTLTMQRFPYPAWTYDPLLLALRGFLSLMFMLSFVYPCINTVKVITTEKEKQLKEAMKIMGLPNWLHWTAWFIKFFIMLLISIMLMSILLKVRWFPDSDFSVLNLVDPFLLFVFLVCYACAIITFCFAISVFFSKANVATTIAGFAWFLSIQYSTLSLAEKMLICLAWNSAMAFGFQMIIMWEGTPDGLVWSNFFSSVTPDDSFTMAHVILMLIIDTFLYLIVALYVEAVFPGDYGVPKRWYFPFTKSFWCGNTKNTGKYTE